MVIISAVDDSTEGSCKKTTHISLVSCLLHYMHAWRVPSLAPLCELFPQIVRKRMPMAQMATIWHFKALVWTNNDPNGMAGAMWWTWLLPRRNHTCAMPDFLGLTNLSGFQKILTRPASRRHALPALRRIEMDLQAILSSALPAKAGHV